MNDKKQYVLCSDNYGIGNRQWDGYYTGSTYFFQGEEYAVCDRDINKAKKYNSPKRAKTAAEALFKRITNYVFEVKEL